jgi:hypothetical protein
MRNVLPVLVFAACTAESPAAPPVTPASRQLDLGGRIFTEIPKLPADPGAQGDGGLALAEVSIPGYAARLRLFVAGDSDPLARGAAEALVRIRLIRQPNRDATLAECVKTETIRWVREACARQMSPAQPVAPVAPTELLPQLDSADAESRRRGLRRLLASYRGGPLDPSVTGRLVHLLKDDDLRVRLLTDAAFLKSSLNVDPPKDGPP